MTPVIGIGRGIMNGRIVTLLGVPVLLAGAVLGAAPAHAGTGVRIDGATVSGGASATVNVTIAYSCDAGDFVASATVTAEDRTSGALGYARFTPNCTGTNVQVTVPVTTLNQSRYAAGDTAAVRASLLDATDTEVVGSITRLTVGTA
ncbi:hypothetical protein ACFV6D_20770 [Kitasatospora sp. NPDC059812]|uniref:hypothetical protein n=1 Tax=Kitasatospora sp. NPDC059812 TaxID=3346958 RepID=UPI00364A22FA